MNGVTATAAGNTAQRVSLAQQLSQVARCVQAVQAGRSLTDVLPTVPGSLRPGVQALVFHALRHLGTSSALVEALTEQAPPPLTHALLCASLALLGPRAQADAGQGAPAYDAFTVVDQAVDAARGQPVTARQAGMVNACLRRYLREAEALQARVEADWVARYNHPAWWVKRVRRDHPQHWQAILAAAQRPAALVLRAHAPAMGRNGLMEAFARAGIQAEAVPAPWHPADDPHPVPDTPEALSIARHVAIDALPGYAEGWFAVQDVAAQMAAPLLLHGLTEQLKAASVPFPTTQRPLRILDACAAPGGKTAHVLAQAHALGWPVQVVALEVDASRAGRITENLQRLRVSADVKVADAANVDAWWDGQLFDAVLLDAPCTASGIVRRHPDVRWLRREGDVAALVDTQRRLLDAIWPVLKPGGRMVYATCSVFKAEGEHQIAAFLGRHINAQLVPAPGHLFPGLVRTPQGMADNSSREHDGFFYARLDKSPV